MGESGGKDGKAETALERYRDLKNTALENFPENVESAVVERDPGDSPKYLRIFLSEGFVDVWLSGSRYSIHFQHERNKIRFDNAPHHDTESSPHHLHRNGDIEESPVEGDFPEDLIQALEIILQELGKEE